MISFLNRNLTRPLAAWKAGSDHFRILRDLERTQHETTAEIQARQLDQLKIILRHAWDTVPFYRERWQKLGFDPASVATLEGLAACPILTKADLRVTGPKLRSSEFQGAFTFAKTTSGSTGVPVTVHVDPACMAMKRAGTLRSDQWSGWKLGSRVARLWGHGDIERGNWKSRLRRRLVERETYLNTLGIDEPRMAAFADELIRKPPGLIFGHAHSLYLFACYVKKHYAGAIHADGIISAAMTLHDWQRRSIEEAFGTPVTNRYGCEEVSLVACECERHRGFHVNADSVYCEVVPDRRCDPSGKSGRLLITDLTNRAMPIIRYQVGDVVVPSTRTCECGRGLPLIESIVGREADYVLTPQGQLISGISLTDHFATEIRGAAQVQIVQESIAFLRLRMVAGDGFGPDSHRQIDSLVNASFGDQMRYEVELVDEIPQEASGKYRFCVSPIANEYMKSLAS